MNSNVIYRGVLSYVMEQSHNFSHANNSNISYENTFISLISKMNELVLIAKMNTFNWLEKLDTESKFCGHLMRKNKLEKLMTPGKFDEKMSRGRQWDKHWNKLAAWHSQDKKHRPEPIHLWSCELANHDRAALNSLVLNDGDQAEMA